MALNPLETANVSCPYCGETLLCFIDTSIEQQHYIEDCQVCCSPIVFTVSIDHSDETVSVETQAENS